MAYFRSNVSGGIPAGLKNLPTVDTASGAIATFDTDLTENLVDVKCQIVAKQASGTPSPDNPLPITTYTEMNVYQYGTNYVDMNDLVQGSFNVNNGNDLASTTRVRTQNKISVPSGTYNIFNKEKYEFVLYVYDENDAFIDGESLKSWQPYGTTITVNANRKIRLGWRKPDNSTMTPSDIHNAVCTSAANGTTSNIPFGQTVANGVLDVTTGKLRVTSDIVDLGSLSGWYYNSTQQFWQHQIVGMESSTENVACEQYQYVYKNWASLVNGEFGTSGENIRLHNDTVSTSADLQTQLSGCHLVFELATPIEIQLDSITLQALLNENNIWCDTGDTEVKFLLTVGKKIS